MRKFFVLLTLFLLGGLTLVNAQTINVTFQVDMRTQILKGNFTPGTDTLTLPGDFNNWLNTPPDNSTKIMDDSDADSIYSLMIAMAPNSTYGYKYNIGMGWDGKDEGSNRSLTVGSNDTTLAPVFYNNEALPSGNPTTVTFNVDMQLPERTGAFDPTQNNVFIAGSFTDWGSGALMLSDADGDSVYTISVDIPSAQKLFFKFVWSPADTVGNPAPDGTTWEDDPNREYWVIDSANVVDAFWNRVNPNLELKDGNISFTVDMSVMTEVGIYDNNTDSLQVRGGFNGWSGSDAAKSHMNQNFLNPDEWFLQVPFVQAPVGGEQNWKFFVVKADTSSLWTDGWERPLSIGGGNRAVNFEGTDNQEVQSLYYDDVLPNYMIEAGNSVSITFSVDMNAAADPTVQALPFAPATDTVYWVGEEPAFVNSQGWVDTDEMRVLALTDDDGDMVYTGTLTVQAPAWNGFEYRYAYASPTNGFIAEPAGFGSFAYRVRYIEQNGYRKFVQPYSAPEDHWTAQEDKSDQWEAAPAGDVTGVEQEGGIPVKFELKQNYPNPFNPSTLIKFAIPKQDLVTLKIYNMLGQEVATLVNKELGAGNYQYNFNASTLSSGVYFYSIKAGSYKATRKMMLLK